MVVPSAKSQSNWRKVDHNATHDPIQGKFRICYRVRTASWPWGWQDRRLRGRRGVLLYRESCKVRSLPKSPADLLTFYSGVNIQLADRNGVVRVQQVGNVVFE